jgi:amidase
VPNAVNELEGFATSGVVTRTVAETAAVLDVIGRPDPLGWYNAPPPDRPWAESVRDEPGRLRIGFTTTPPVEVPMDDACVDAVRRTAEALSGLGHDVEEVELSMPDADAFVEAFGIVWNVGSASVPLDDWDAIEPLNAALRRAGRSTDSISYVEAVARTQLLGRPLMANFVDGPVDVLVTPTMAVEPPRCGSVWEGADVEPMLALMNCFPMAVFTSVWNVTGLPALSLPLHQAPSGLPVGVQLVAGPWREDLLLQLGATLESALPWKDRRPAIAG